MWADRVSLEKGMIVDALTSVGEHVSHAQLHQLWHAGLVEASPGHNCRVANAEVGYASQEQLAELGIIMWVEPSGGVFQQNEGSASRELLCQ